MIGCGSTSSSSSDDTPGNGDDETDVTAPTILTKTPSNNAEEVSVSTVISVTFSESMDTDTITTNTFTLVASSGPVVTGVVSYDAGSLTASLTPSEELSQDTTYIATVFAAVADVAGNQLGSSESWQFTTAASPEPSTRLDWEYNTESAMYYSSPAIGDSGTIYIGTGYWLLYSGERENRGLYAINSDGTLSWYYPIDAEVFSPVVGADETIYVQDYANNLYAIHSDGTLSWKHETTEQSSNVGCATPAIGSDGTIYMAGYNKTLYAINPDGSLRWTYMPTSGGGVLRTSPAIGSNGIIYVAMGYILYAVDSEGNLEWSCSMGGVSDVFSSPAIDSAGNIYVGGEGSSGADLSYVFSVSPEGTVNWSYEISGDRPVRSSPAIDSDGNIYVGTKAGDVNAEVLALDSAGNLLWSYEMTQADQDIYVSPAIGADGTIYVGDEWGIITALNSDGTVKWQYQNNDGGAFNWSSPAIASDGTLYIGNTYGGRLFAIDTTSLGLADSAWPKFHRNNKNTGRR